MRTVASCAIAFGAALRAMAISALESPIRYCSTAAIRACCSEAANPWLPAARIDASRADCIEVLRGRAFLIENVAIFQPLLPPFGGNYKSYHPRTKPRWPFADCLGVGTSRVITSFHC